MVVPSSLTTDSGLVVSRGRCGRLGLNMLPRNERCAARRGCLFCCVAALESSAPVATLFNEAASVAFLSDELRG